MFNRYLIAAAVALPLGIAGMSGGAFAYATKYYIPVKPVQSTHSVHRAAMSCAAAGRMIRAEGYKNVKARDCDDRNYVFHAVRHGRSVVLHVNPRNGHVWRA